LRKIGIGGHFFRRVVLIIEHNNKDLDMVDQNVRLPRGFTREFVEEVEADLIRDHQLDKFDLQNHFAYLNPQKEE
jgi:hypothetical protein